MAEREDMVRRILTNAAGNCLDLGESRSSSAGCASFDIISMSFKKFDFWLFFSASDGLFVWSRER